MALPEEEMEPVIRVFYQTWPAFAEWWDREWAKRAASIPAPTAVGPDGTEG